MKCQHKNKCFTKIEPKAGLLVSECSLSSGFLFNIPPTFVQLPPIDGCIITDCADCGKELKRVVIPYVAPTNQ